MSNYSPERPQRQLARTTLRWAGISALAGSLFCGIESGSHFLKAKDSIHGIQTSQPATNDALEKRIILVGDETAMRNYGIGFVALGVLGTGGLAINRRLDSLSPTPAS